MAFRFYSQEQTRYAISATADSFKVTIHCSPSMSDYERIENDIKITPVPGFTFERNIAEKKLILTLTAQDEIKIDKRCFDKADNAFRNAIAKASNNRGIYSDDSCKIIERYDAFFYRLGLISAFSAEKHKPGLHYTRPGSSDVY